MNKPISTYTEGDYLVVHHTDSETPQPPTQPEQDELPRSKPAFMNLGFLYCLTLGTGLAMVMVSKTLFLGYVYFEEWTIALACVLLAAFGILLVARIERVSRWCGRFLIVGSLGMLLLLCTSSFSTTLATGMAIRWMEKSGAHVTQNRRVDDFVSAFLGDRWGGYFLSANSLDLQLPNVKIPPRVILDLSNQPLGLELPVTRGQAEVSPAISLVADLFLHQGITPQIRTTSLGLLSDCDLILLGDSGMRMNDVQVEGPLSKGTIDYLCSSKNRPAKYLTCERLSSEDIMALSKIRNGKQPANLYMVDCEIDQRSAPVISELSSAITFLNSLKRHGRGKWPMDSKKINLLVAYQVPVMQLECDYLWGREYQGLSELKSLQRIKLISMDGAAVDALASTQLSMVHIDFLTSDAVESMVRNQVSWAVNAEQTDATFDAITPLLQSVKYFYLRDRSQFTPEERSKMVK